MIKINKTSISCFIFTLIFILFAFSELFSVTYLEYVDEIVGVFAFLYILFKFIVKRINKSSLKIKKILLLLILIIITGILGNLIWKINNFDIYNILLDIFLFIKPYLIFLFAYTYLSDFEINRLLKAIKIISKIMIIILFASCVLFIFDKSFFSGSYNQFIFLSGFGGTVSNWIIIFLSIIILTEKKISILYYLLSSIIIYYSNSGLGLLGLLIILAFSFISKQIHFKWYYLLVFIPFALITSYDEISGYLLDISSPRGKFFYYSFVTANQYFPIGSGFASYGSMVAANNYSNLYYLYDFNTIWGMTADSTSYLLDNYYPMIIGQFGYFGFVCFLLIVKTLYFDFIKNIYNKKRRYAAIEIFIYIFVMALGFNISGVGGCAMFLILAIYCSKTTSNNQNYNDLLENRILINK